MKKTALLIVLLFSVLTLSNAQNVEVPQTQTPMIVKIAASWCPPCGGWSWNFFDDIYDDNADDAVLLSVHHSGDHTNQTASDLTSNFNVFGQPRFIFDGVDQNVSSSNASTKRNDFATMVNDLASSNPRVQAGIDARYSGDELMVDYAVEVFENLAGVYTISLYLVEKIHVGYQANQGNNAEHKGLLRGELSGNSLGTVLFTNGASVGDVFSGSLSAPLENYDPENLDIVSVIWKEDGGKYIFENSNVDHEVEEQITSDIEDITLIESGLKVFPTVVRDDFVVEFYNSVPGEDFRISISDLFGRTIQRIEKADSAEGLQSMRFFRTDDQVPGIYYVTLENRQDSFSKKVIFE